MDKIEIDKDLARDLEIWRNIQSKFKPNSAGEHVYKTECTVCGKERVFKISDFPSLPAGDIIYYCSSCSKDNDLER
jgi:hypothetical protein